MQVLKLYESLLDLISQSNYLCFLGTPPLIKIIYLKILLYQNKLNKLNETSTFNFGWLF